MTITQYITHHVGIADTPAWVKPRLVADICKLVELDDNINCALEAQLEQVSEADAELINKHIQLRINQFINNAQRSGILWCRNPDGSLMTSSSVGLDLHDNEDWLEEKVRLRAEEKLRQVAEFQAKRRQAEQIQLQDFKSEEDRQKYLAAERGWIKSKLAAMTPAERRAHELRAEKARIIIQQSMGRCVRKTTLDARHKHDQLVELRAKLEEKHQRIHSELIRLANKIDELKSKL